MNKGFTVDACKLRVQIHEDTLNFMFACILQDSLPIFRD